MTVRPVATGFGITANGIDGYAAIIRFYRQGGRYFLSSASATAPTRPPARDVGLYDGPVAFRLRATVGIDPHRKKAKRMQPVHLLLFITTPSPEDEFENTNLMPWLFSSTVRMFAQICRRRGLVGISSSASIRRIVRGAT